MRRTARCRIAGARRHKQACLQHSQGRAVTLASSGALLSILGRDEDPIIDTFDLKLQIIETIYSCQAVNFDLKAVNFTLFTLKSAEGFVKITTFVFSPASPLASPWCCCVPDYVRYNKDTYTKLRRTGTQHTVNERRQANLSLCIKFCINSCRSPAPATPFSPGV